MNFIVYMNLMNNKFHKNELYCPGGNLSWVQTLTAA